MTTSPAAHLAKLAEVAAEMQPLTDQLATLLEKRDGMIRRAYKDGTTPTQIGGVLGISRGRVNQIIQEP